MTQGTPKQLYGKPWSEREYVISLFFYLRHKDQPRHETVPYVVEQARILGRTPSSIVMRMENFGSLDREGNQARKGLSNVGPMCRKIFVQWRGDPEGLKACAELLIRDASPTDSMSLFEPELVRLPKAFKRYELLDRLGDGGSGSVFSCIDIRTSERYAIKIIRADNRFDREIVHRFFREMRILAATSHSNVIRLHESNLDSESAFPAFVMDLADCSLAQHMQNIAGSAQDMRPCLTTTEASTIFRAIAAGAAALHSAGVIHRDINPNNILRLPTGEWVLSDFGLAKYLLSAATASTFVTNTHAGWGTAYYAAPEQYRDFKRTDERTDIYALGMLLWELFAEAWPPPESRNTGMSKQLEQIFLRATARKSSERFPSVLDLLGAFESVQTSLVQC